MRDGARLLGLVAGAHGIRSGVPTGPATAARRERRGACRRCRVERGCPREPGGPGQQRPHPRDHWRDRDIESQNPYADSVALRLRHLVRSARLPGDLWTPRTGDYAPGAGRELGVESPTTWIFHLRRDASWQDGSPFTAADVMHSVRPHAERPGRASRSTTSRPSSTRRGDRRLHGAHHHQGADRLAARATSAIC